jgi:hypothetical protein
MALCALLAISPKYAFRQGKLEERYSHRVENLRIQQQRSISGEATSGLDGATAPDNAIKPDGATPSDNSIRPEVSTRPDVAMAPGEPTPPDDATAPEAPMHGNPSASDDASRAADEGLAADKSINPDGRPRREKLELGMTLLPLAVILSVIIAVAAVQLCRQRLGRPEGTMASDLASFDSFLTESMAPDASASHGPEA